MGSGLFAILFAALATLLGMLVSTRFLPPTFALAGGLAIGGAGAYAFGHKSASEGMIGAAIGLAALPLVANLLGGGGGGSGLTVAGSTSQSSPASVWV